jgi:hypothetical protein
MQRLLVRLSGRSKKPSVADIYWLAAMQQQVKHRFSVETDVGRRRNSAGDMGIQFSSGATGLRPTLKETRYGAEQRIVRAIPVGSLRAGEDVFTRPRPISDIFRALGHVKKYE